MLYLCISSQISKSDSSLLFWKQCNHKLLRIYVMKYAKENSKGIKTFTTPWELENSLIQSIIIPNSFQNNHEAMLYHILLSYLCVKTSRAHTFDDWIIFKDLIRILYQTIPNKY